MTILLDLNLVKYHDIIEVTCDDCASSFSRRKRDIMKSRAIFGEDVCRSCAAKIKSKVKPQCSPSGWSAEKRAEHGLSVKSSEAYYAGIASRPTVVGVNNPMYGKKVSQETRAKMRASRIGKTGRNATAWRSGTTRLIPRIRRVLETRFRWYTRVIEREGGICQVCFGPGNEGHHIVPLGQLVPTLLMQISVQPGEDPIEWLLSQDSIADHALTNGKCVCRPCHKLEHLNWGSHEPKTR